jgi:hypothetical protein
MDTLTQPSRIASTSTTAERQLRLVLRLNAGTSAAAGLVALVFGGALDELLGTGHPGWVRLVGAGLVLFAIDVVLVAGSRPAQLRRLAPIVSVADAGWVAFTVASIVAGWYSAPGAVLMAAVGLMVAGFGIEQFVLARRLEP